MQPRVLIVTGYSGAGKTSMLKALEDIGFLCIDNIPTPLLPGLFDYCAHKSEFKKIALGIDVRNDSSIEEFLKNMSVYKEKVEKIEIVFLISDTAQMLMRFQETRRKHPLAQGITLHEAIEQEKKMLQPLMMSADLIVDTGHFTLHQLRTFVRVAFAQDNEPTLLVNLMSFGFKYGVPQECNYVYDLRSLPNPYFTPHLRARTGLDAEVVDFLFSQPETQEYWQKLTDFFYFSIQKSLQEGRFFIHIAVGCTGGKHRSVAFVQELAKKNMDGVTFLVSHRDLYKDREAEKKNIEDSLMKKPSEGIHEKI